MTTFNAKDISLKGTETGKNKFCTAWPPTKVGLQALAAIVKEPLLQLERSDPAVATCDVLTVVVVVAVTAAVHPTDDV